MTKYETLELWIVAALKDLGGEGSVPQIAKHIWDNHEQDLRTMGDLFYTWQYAMRWAGQNLQKSKVLVKNNKLWKLV